MKPGSLEISGDQNQAKVIPDANGLNHAMVPFSTVRQIYLGSFSLQKQHWTSSKTCLDGLTLQL